MVGRRFKYVVSVAPEELSWVAGGAGRRHESRDGRGKINGGRGEKMFESLVEIRFFTRPRVPGILPVNSLGSGNGKKPDTLEGKRRKLENTTIPRAHSRACVFSAFSNTRVYTDRKCIFFPFLSGNL